MKKTSMLLFIVLSLIIATNVVGAQNIELTYWTHTDDNRTIIENRYIEEFQALYPNVTIKRVVNEASKMGDLMLTAFSANNAPDLFNLPIEQEYGYMMHHRVAPVNYEAIGYANAEELVSQYMAGTFDTVMMDGQIYGLPLELTNWSLYINKNVFRDAGLDPEKDYPKTWEEMIEVADKLTLRNGEIITRRGFDFRYPYYLVAMLPMVEQLGGQLLSDDGKTAIVNDEAWIQVFEWFRTFGPHGRNLGSPTYTSARKIFNMDNNDIGMCLTGFYQQGRIRIDNPEFYDSGEWMVVPYPVFENAVKDVRCSYYGHFMMVNAQASAEKQYWAWKFIAYMLDHGWEYLETVNIIQPRQDLLDDPRYMELPYMDVFMTDMAKSHMVFLHENGFQFERFIKEAIESVMLSNMPSEEALDILRERIQEVLDDSY